jgi:type II secretory pathway pseudopilin PulG
MRPTRPRPARSKQRGAVLMVMLVIMVMGIAAALVGSLGSTALKNARHATTAAALAQAKDALIGYAVTYGETHSGYVHGYLPCPDPNGTGYGANSEGSSETCGSMNVSAMGRLPWKTLGLPALLDGSGECLWYAVSGTYKNNPMTGKMMNQDTPGLFEILDSSGAAVAQNVVAVIFSPGTPLGIQNRAPDGTAPVCGGNYTPSNYLDNDGTINNAAVSGVADAVSQFRLGYSALLNDRMIYITREDIFNARNIRAKLDSLTRKAAECIADYGRRNDDGPSDKRLPWSGRFWPSATDYLTDSNYDDEDGRMAGRLPYRANTSASDTDNQIVSPYYQLASNGTNCPGVADWPGYYPWWKNWKDHLYYALAEDFKPDDDSDSSCGTCLSVNGTGNYAAVVMFSGQALTGQTRATTGDRLDLGNYLEGRNYSNGSNSSGNSNYQSGSTSSFNDVLYCINPDLAVTPC